MTDTTNRDAFIAKVNSATDMAALQEAVESYAKAQGKRLPTVAEVTLGYSMVLTDIFGKELAQTITVPAARATRRLMAEADAQKEEASFPVPTQGPAN